MANLRTTVTRKYTDNKHEVERYIETSQSNIHGPGVNLMISNSLFHLNQSESLKVRAVPVMESSFVPTNRGIQWAPWMFG